MAGWVRYALDRVAPGRPYTDTEHGPIHMFNDHRKILPEAFVDEYERHMMWAHLAFGGAGSGMRWPARHPHKLTMGMKQALGSMSRFCEDVEWRNFTPRDDVADVKVNVRSIHTFACRDNQQAIIWLLRNSSQRGEHGVLPVREPIPKLNFTLRGLEPGDYVIRTWNTREGSCAGCYTASVGVSRQRQNVEDNPGIYAE